MTLGTLSRFRRGTYGQPCCNWTNLLLGSADHSTLFEPGGFWVSVSEYQADEYFVLLPLEERQKESGP